MSLVFALVVIAAWGVWLVPAHAARTLSQITVVAYATLANLVAAAVVAALAPTAAGLSATTFATIAIGGALWTVGGVCAFAAVDRLGPARAMGIWSPLNILVSLAWGGALFAEFAGLPPIVAALTAAGGLALVAGLLVIIRAREPSTETGSALCGHLAAVGAGVLWGSYFLPVRFAGVSAWKAAFPMALGMTGAAILFMFWRRLSWRLPTTGDYARLPAAGLLWAAGNYASLQLMERIGTGRGFAVAQLCLVLNAVVGIHILRRPPPHTSAARRVIAGCALATAGGILLGLFSR